MRTFLKNAWIPFKISAAMVSGLCGLEAAGFYLTGVSYPYSEFLSAVAAGLVMAALFAVAASAFTAFFKQVEPVIPKLASVSGSLALLYLLLVLWLRGFAFTPSHPRWFILLGLLVLLVIVAGLGRMLWYYLTRVYSDLAKARFQALAPMSVLCVGLYSVAYASVSEAGNLALAALAILLLFVIGQYTAIRFIWARSRIRFVKWGGRLQILLLAVIPVWALMGAAVQYKNEHKPAAAPPGSPSVILITIDTLRADYLSFNNPKIPPTPVMDALARDGVNFTHVMAPGTWTEPSGASIVTGLNPKAVGAAFFPTGLDADYTGPLPDAVTLAQVFAENGYVTAAFVDNTWLSPSRGYDKGFRSFELMGDVKLLPRFLIARSFETVYRPFHPYARHRGAQLTDRALAWLNDRPQGPFFLWVHYLDPHLPYEANDEYPTRTKPGPRGIQFAMTRYMFLHPEAYEADKQDIQFVRERYDGEVRFADAQVGRVISWLKQHDLYDESVICLSSDHGEELWEHQTFTHGHNYYDVTIHVPLAIKLPGRKSAGTVITPWVSNHRLGATLLDAAGIKSRFPGASLLPCLNDPMCGDATFFGRFWTTECSIFGGQVAAVGDIQGKKAIFSYDGTLKCYDLAADPEEQHPFDESVCPWPQDAPGPREVLKIFRDKDQEIFKALGGETARRTASTGEERRRLKALGYIQ